MPRRSSARTSATAVVEPQAPQEHPPLDPLSENLRNLRQHWKWAAFCQFLYTFFDLVAINDISIEDIENDLTHGTDVFIPRIMQRLLVTLTYDRKISLDNWQNALRRQYDRRDPDANPLGSQSVVHTANNSRFTSVQKEEEGAAQNGDLKEEDGDTKVENEASAEASAEDSTAVVNGENSKLKKQEDRLSSAPEGKTTVDWAELTMEQKLDSMHTLVEWQFQNPTRLRGLMKSDDENATWRSEPIGYDRESNAYWLIAGNRLWIQRSPPKPPNRKRKRKANGGPEPKRGSTSKAGSSKRQRLTKSQSGTKAPTKEPPPTPTTGRSSRAAKEQANAKLDAQAKALAEFNRQVGGGSKTTPTTTASGRSTRSRNAKPSAQAVSTLSTRSKPAGTRISARLRGVQDDGWQAVPDEWLNDEAGPSKATKTGLESDDGSISDLTELSDEEGAQEEKEAVEESKDVQDEEAEPAESEEPVVQTPYVEWETLCVTLADWQAFPERFANSTFYAEKAFYKLLTTIIVPDVVAELKAVEEQRRLEEALTHRKRSSRLATREHEKEAVKLAAQKKAEEEERNGRTRRLEARQQREEAERIKREKAREERRLKRESRAVEQELEGKDDDEENDDEDAGSSASVKDDNEEYRPSPVPSASKRASRQPARQQRQPAKKAEKSAADEWELNCEVCGTSGKNLDDGKPMMSCGICNKWQHIPCHDQREARLGRPKRNWAKIEFFCQRCLAQKANGSHRQSNGTSHSARGMQPTMQHMHSSSGWQSGAGYNKGYGVPEPSPYAQSYLAPTSSVRSSYPAPTVYATPNPYAASSNISFTHYQPQDRAFASEAGRAPMQQNSYYRVNNQSAASWTADPPRYHPPQPSYAPPSQHAWTANHYANSHPTTSLYGTPNHHTPLTTPATFQQQQQMAGPGVEPRAHNGAVSSVNGVSNGSGSVHRASYDSLAREAAYQQQRAQYAAAAAATQPTMPSSTIPPISHNRTAAAYPPQP